MVTINNSLQLNMTKTDFLGLPSDAYEDEIPTSVTTTTANAVTSDGVVSYIFRGSFNPELIDAESEGDNDPLVNYITGYTEYRTATPSESFVIDGLPNFTLAQFEALNPANWLSGFDVITSGSYNDVLRGFGSGDAINGGGGNDTILGGSDYADTSDGSDQIYGGRGADVIYGNAGNDTIYGGNDRSDTLDSADIIFGGAGTDVIYGNAGDDVIHGNADNDSIYGGLGNDTFAFAKSSGQDVIYGFEGDGVAGGDVIAISSSIYSTGAQAMQHVTSDGTHAYLDLGNGSGVLILSGGSIAASDFSFF